MDGDNTGELDLGTEFYLSLMELSDSSETHEDDTVEQLIHALNVTTTLQTLEIDFDDYEPTPEHNRRFIDPLC